MNAPKLHRLITRCIAATFAMGTTWLLFGGVISISEPQRHQMYTAIAARQATPAAHATILAEATAKRPLTSQAW